MLNIKRILIPVDFSPFCSQALSYGWALAERFSASVDLLHVIEEPAFPSFYRIGEEALYGEVETLQERAQEALKECMAETRQEIENGVGYHIERGKAADKIVEVAEVHDTDLIVISTHGLSGVEKVLMGSVAQAVVQKAPCPVFTVKSYGKSLLRED